MGWATRKTMFMLGDLWLLELDLSSGVSLCMPGSDVNVRIKPAIRFLSLVD